MTITEQILATHAGRKRVKPGENIWIDVDFLMTHDVCGPGTIGIFKREFGDNAKVWDKNRVVIIPDHYIFTKDKHAKRNIEILRDFVTEQHLPNFYDVGSNCYKGVCHVALAEEGFTVPGTVLFGTDSHTCTAGAFGQFATGIGNTDAGFIMGTGKLWVRVPETQQFILEGEMPAYLMAKDVILQIIGDIGVDGATYQVIEFSGDGIKNMEMEERMTLCNMAIEAGGKTGIVPPDQKTVDYLGDRVRMDGSLFQSNGDAYYVRSHSYSLKNLEPIVACPFSPGHVHRACDLSEIKLDQCYIGSCTGGKIVDFRAAAKILKDHTVQVKTLIVPSTTQVEKAIQTEKVDGVTLRDIFQNACAEIGPPSCAACLGGPEDTFGRLNNDEVCLSTTNRNFPGRMGTPKSQTYLASPLTVAASALTGRITDPREYLS